MKVNSRLLLAFLEPLFIFQSRNSISPKHELADIVCDSASLTVTITGVAGAIRKKFTGAATFSLPFQLLVPIEVLHRTLKMIADTDISLEQQGNNLHIDTTTAHYQIGGEQYETQHFQTKPGGQIISAKALRTAIERVLPICSTDELRPAMCGVFFDASEKNNRATVATDGHRIAWFSYELNIDRSFIIHRESARLIIETLKTLDEVQVNFDENNIYFETPDTIFYGRLIRETFPAWRMVLPKFETPVLFNIEAGILKNAIKRMTVYATNSTQRILFHLNGQALQLQSANLDYGQEASETLNIDHQGADLTIAFNGPKVRDLLGMLDIADNETVGFKLNKSNQGAYITGAEDKNYTSFLMPLHLEA